jgi:hypothetical protein
MYRNTTRELSVGSTSELFRTEVDLNGLDRVRGGVQQEVQSGLVATEY